MTDLEITKLCAEAMGFKSRQIASNNFQGYDAWQTFDDDGHSYSPLHDRAQAMELVEKFRLQIDPYDEQWNVATPGIGVLAEDLLRAICSCVAKMQIEKNK